MSSSQFRLLVTAYDYRPRLGGIATLGYEVLREMSKIDGIKIRLLAPREKGGEEFDLKSSIETRRISISRGMVSSSIQFASAMTQEIFSWKPDAILNFVWIPEGIASFLCAPARKIRGVPYFVYAHGVEIMESKRSFKRRLRSFMSPLKYSVFRGAESIFVNSHFTKNLVFDRCKVEKDKISVAHPGVDSSRYFPKATAEDLIKLHSLEGKKVFFTLTRLDDYKGIDHAILGLKPVISRYPNAVYLVCGEGRDRPRLEKLIRDDGMSSYVIMAGAIPFDRVQDYYNLADVFVMLSREHMEPPDVEGFGIVYLEAAACGKPSIAGKSGGISDAVEDGKSGWLVDPMNIAEISRVMREVLENPTQVQERGRYARERVKAQFTWEKMAKLMASKITRQTKP